MTSQLAHLTDDELVAARTIPSIAAPNGRVIWTRNQAAPTPQEDRTPPPQTGGPQAVSGVVREYSDNGANRPVPNLRLKVRQGSSNGGAVGGASLDDVVTDAEGRYSIPGVSGILFFQTDPASGYRFLCDAYPLIVRFADARYPFVTDLPVVHGSWSGNRPPQPWNIGTSVWGTVSERGDAGLQPVPGATVQLDTGTQDPPATTTASGFYMICSVVGTDQMRTITASKESYNLTTREFFGGWDFTLHIELTRK
jgi:hypothetical protein